VCLYQARTSRSGTHRCTIFGLVVLSNKRRWTLTLLTSSIILARMLSPTDFRYSIRKTLQYSCTLLLFRIRSLTSSIHLRNVMNSSLLDRLRKSSLSSSRRVQCLDIHPLRLGLAQISLLPCLFLHHYLDVHLNVLCVLLLYRAFLDELFPVPSVMFSRMLYYPSLRANPDWTRLQGMERAQI
jgi:hypothetical protein